MQGRPRRQYPLNPRNIFGLSTMRWTVVARASLMTSAFMLCLTDYSGLANAALVSTILLTFGRILDAVDDPLQGWIMDNTRPTPIGKSKPFLLGRHHPQCACDGPAVWRTGPCRRMDQDRTPVPGLRRLRDRHLVPARHSNQGHQLSGFVSGCVFTFVVAAVSYYIKWAYGLANSGLNAAIRGAMILFGIVAGTLVAPRILRRSTPVQGAIICNIGAVLPLAAVYLLNLPGPVDCYLFLLSMFLSLVFSGMAYIPGSMISMECMDHNRWKIGKGMEATVQAVVNFTNKAQVALAGLATGAVLVAIRYDAALYESEAFAASGGTIPPSLFAGLAIVFCLIPVCLGITAVLILTVYPLKRTGRERMYAELGKIDQGGSSA